MGKCYAELRKSDYVLAFCNEPGYGIVDKEDAEEGDYSRPIFHSTNPDEVAKVWDSMAE